jgi:hypothetical protein
LKERDIEIQILTWVNQQPEAFLFKINQSGFFDGKAWRKRNNGSLNGVSDCLGIWKTKPLAIEVKKPGEKPSREQTAFMNHYIKMGGIAFCATSLEEVKSALS